MDATIRIFGPLGPSIACDNVYAMPFQSEIMAREFEKHGVPDEFISVKNGEHSPGGADRKDIEAAHAKVLPFIRKHTGRQSTLR